MQKKIRNDSSNHFKPNAVKESWFVCFEKIRQIAGKVEAVLKKLKIGRKIQRVLFTLPQHYYATSNGNDKVCIIL